MGDTRWVSACLCEDQSSGAQDPLKSQARCGNLPAIPGFRRQRQEISRETWLIQAQSMSETLTQSMSEAEPKVISDQG